LEEILRPSYGILAFQDDVLLTAITLAGYTWLDADKFRKAMGKKIPEEMKKQREMFITGAVKNGLTPKRAEEIFDLIAPFAGYGFNKAHASCYATIAYRTAYLKANYPVEFMTALLTAENRGSTGPAKNEKISQAIAECKRLKIEILPPSVNHSAPEFMIEDATKIRFGLSAIKNVGGAAISTILEARAHSKFTSIFDFATRVDLSKVNKKTVESLIKAGAMDAFGKRATLLETYPALVEKINKKAKAQARNQVSLFGDTEEEEVDEYGILDSGTDFTPTEKLMFEKELLGFFLTGHPLSHMLENLERSITHSIEELKETQTTRTIKTGGMIAQVKKIFTKKSNAEMAFVTVEDQFGRQMECVVFPKTFEQSRQLLINDTVILINGKLDFKDEQPVILVETVQKFYNI
jgi:DNA polymerase-3 subunit alpha